MSPLAEAFTIKSVSNLTQLSEFTLRSWEKRHAVVKPKRLASGRRVYQASDIEKLRLLKVLVDSGESIGQLATQSLSQLKKLEGLLKPGRGVQQASVNGLLQYLKSFDLDALSSEIRKLQLKFETRVFLIEIVAPFLQAIGEGVAKGNLDIYQEHAASAILRNTLSGILFLTEQSFERSEGPTIVLSTPENDFHEFGILICAILSRMKGVKVLYLGPNLPARSIVKACLNLEKPLLLLGLSAPEVSVTNAKLLEYFQVVDIGLKPKVRIWLGGIRCYELRNFKFRGSRSTALFENFAKFEQALESLT